MREGAGERSWGWAKRWGMKAQRQEEGREPGLGVEGWEKTERKSETRKDRRNLGLGKEGGKGTGSREAGSRSGQGGQGGKGCVQCVLGALYLLPLGLPPLLLPPQGLHVLQPPLLLLLLQLSLLPFPPLLLWVKRGAVLRAALYTQDGLARRDPSLLLGISWKGNHCRIVRASLLLTRDDGEREWLQRVSTNLPTLHRSP